MSEPLKSLSEREQDTLRLLLAGHEAEWTIKKGALWWLSNRVRRGETQTVLRAVIPAELLE